jgi:hypothetical protein
MSPLDCLIGDFANCLDYYIEKEPLNSRSEQYIATVKLRKQFSSVTAAIADDEFLRNLHSTLEGFFRLARIGLLPLDQFKQELSRHQTSIASFEGEKLGTEPEATGAELSKLISQLNLTKKKEKKGKKATEDNPRLVSGTKTLHLLLPDLVVPIDREYTRAFLFRYTGDFDAGDAEQETFRTAFATFHTIAKAVAPETYVGKHPMHTTPTKVIDNGMMGFVELVRAQFQGLIPAQ